MSCFLDKKYYIEYCTINNCRPYRPDIQFTPLILTRGYVCIGTLAATNKNIHIKTRMKMDNKKSKIDKNAKIVIIGAGPAGLSTAWYLSKNGFNNVTVLEKLGRVGGLCKSLTVDGMSYDLGANYVTWAYQETLKIADEKRDLVPFTKFIIEEMEKSKQYISQKLKR